MGRRGRNRQRREAGGRPPSSSSTPSSSDGGRYTAPSRPFRIRPDWHRPVGWLIVVVGAAIAVLNDVAPFVDYNLVPGGHSELYLVLAVVVAGAGTWFLGLFDPPS